MYVGANRGIVPAQVSPASGWVLTVPSEQGGYLEGARGDVSHTGVILV